MITYGEPCDFFDVTLTSAVRWIFGLDAAPFYDECLTDLGRRELWIHIHQVIVTPHAVSSLVAIGDGTFKNSVTLADRP